MKRKVDKYWLNVCYEHEFCDITGILKKDSQKLYVIC